MKDTWTPIAIGAGFVVILVSMLIDGSNPVVLIKPAPIALVFGGTILAGTAGYLKSDIRDLKRILQVVFKSPLFDGEASIREFVRLSALVKSGGVLELDRAKEVSNDEFLSLGFSLVAGNKNSDDIRELLENEVETMSHRHRTGARIFQEIGGYAPTFGIIGTVIGLIHVLGSLSSPAAIGPAIASAFTATLWGVLSANVIFLPMSKKLKRINDLEVQYRQMQIEGIVALQRGEGQRDVRDRMQVYIAPSERFPDGKRSAA